MDYLPSELGQAICGLLEKEDLQSLRLVAKYFNELSIPFLFDEVQLVLHPKSFDRLSAIARHPVISKCIKTLYYEPDMLERFERFERWEGRIHDPNRLNSIPHRPQLGASDEDFEAYELALEDWQRTPNHTYTAEELETGWIQYQQLLQGQQDLMKSRCGKRELEEAMAHLSNLQSLCVTMGNTIEPASEYLRNCFSSGLKSPCDDIGNGHAAGVPQVRSLYHSAYINHLKLKTLVCGGVNWRIFKSPKQDLVELARVMSESKNLCLKLSTGYDEHQDRIGSELTQCRRYLKNGRIRDMVTQATQLQSLEIHFDWSDPVFAVELKNVVGVFTWIMLTRVSLGYMETTEEDLVAFFRRYALSLRSLHLDNFHLTSGQWSTALPRIRSYLNHTDDVLLEGHLSCSNPSLEYYLGMAAFSDPTDPEDKPLIERRKALEDWFQNGGDCPLDDAWLDE
ncbi:MAG: hypothetical protein Q9201_002149 [Fulgogasparrea decipioides]